MNTDHLLLVSYTENCQEYEGQAKDREARRQAQNKLENTIGVVSKSLSKFSARTEKLGGKLKTSSKTRLGYTHMPIKIGIQSARLAEIHQLQDENGHREGRSKQSRPDSSIQPVTQPRTQRDPRLHLPISPHAFLRYATFPHMHYVTFPTCILALCAIMCEGLGATRRAAPYTLYIFADLRRTRCQTSSFNTPSALLGVTLGEPAWYGGRRWQMVLQCL